MAKPLREVVDQMAGVQDHIYATLPPRAREALSNTVFMIAAMHQGRMWIAPAGTPWATFPGQQWIEVDPGPEQTPDEDQAWAAWVKEGTGLYASVEEVFRSGYQAGPRG